VLSSGIVLEMAEMTEDDSLNAETGGVKSEGKGNHILVLGGGRGGGDSSGSGWFGRG